MESLSEENGVAARSIEGLIRNQLSNQLAILRDCTPRVQATMDPEAVHQLRVCARRLEALLSALFREHRDPETKGLAREIKGFIRASGGTRDLDVQIDSVPKPRSHGDSNAQEFYSRHLVKARESERQSLRDLLEEGPGAGLAERIEALVERKLQAHGAPTAREALRQIFDRQLKPIKRLRRHAGKRKAKRRLDRDLHRLRIRLKKLRYSLEPFVPIYSDPLVCFLKQLAKLQTQLGDFHDACVSLRTLDRYSKRAEIPTAKALAKLRTRQQKQRDRLRALIHEHGISELRQLIRKKSLREIFGDAI